MSSTATEKPPAARSEEFCADAFPHLDLVYSDAYCLTGNHEDAADLVLEAYVQAFRGYEQFRHQRTQNALACLYENRHAVFCETILVTLARGDFLSG